MSSKAISTVAISGILASVFGDKLVANIAGADMPWFAQFGLCGLFGFLLWWNMERGDKRSAKAMDDVKDEIGAMRTDLKSGQAETNQLLRAALFENRGPK